MKTSYGTTRNAQYGYCYWHREVPHRVGIRRTRSGDFRGTYRYCSVCRPRGGHDISDDWVRPKAA